MQKPTAAALLLTTLALTACGGGTTMPTPAPLIGVADDTDDGALTLASRTVTLSPTQARALGLMPQTTPTPTSPVTVTVAVKLGKEGTRYEGQKRAFIGWKLNGKTFPADLTGTTTVTYALSLTDGAGATLGKAKTGSVTAALPLPSGTMNTSRSRSTGYVEISTGACAVASFDLTLPTRAGMDSGAVPLVVCEPGLTPPAPAPVQSPTLEGVSLRTWFSPAYGQMNAFAGLSNVPAGAGVAARYTFRDAEECGAGDRYGVSGSGDWTKTSGSDAGQPVYRVAIDEQSMIQGEGLEYHFTLTLAGKTREFTGVLCYRTQQSGPL